MVYRAAVVGRDSVTHALDWRENEWNTVNFVCRTSATTTTMAVTLPQNPLARECAVVGREKVRAQDALKLGCGHGRYVLVGYWKCSSVTVLLE